MINPEDFHIITDTALDVAKAFQELMSIAATIVYTPGAKAAPAKIIVHTGQGERRKVDSIFGSPVVPPSPMGQTLTAEAVATITMASSSTQLGT